MSDPTDYTFQSAASGRHQLYRSSLTAIGLLLAYCIYNGWSLPFEQLALALVVVILAAWPAIAWLRSQPYQFPAFEAFMLTCIPSYALPLISNHSSVLMFSDTVIFKSLAAIVLFQVTALFAFKQTLARERSTLFWNEVLFTRDISHWLPAGLWLNTAYIAVSRFTEWIPWEIDSILRAVFFGIATSCSFLLGREWGSGGLSQRRRLNVLFALLISSLLLMASLYLINAIAAVLVFFLAYLSAGRRIPWVALGLVFVVLSVLHNGKTEMREKYWAEGAPRVALTDLPEFFSEWIELGIAPMRDDEDAPKRRELLDRASLLQIICLVVETTDNGLPFLAGETYGYVLPQFVPRIFWSDKPTGQITTRRLGIHFGLQDESSAKTTSIGFGVFAEAFANFGYWGVGLLGLLIGTLNKVISMWTRNSPMLSNGGLIMILLMAWSIQVELPMSGWVSSLYQAAFCVLGVPFIIKRFFNA
ncbi:MAG: hypothetical protein KF897_05590 [Opitutaceae bacterium]|nr:hypothetical protein [Opitutaceae bacterium]